MRSNHTVPLFISIRSGLLQFLNKLAQLSIKALQLTNCLCDFCRRHFVRQASLGFLDNLRGLVPDLLILFLQTGTFLLNQRLVNLFFQCDQLVVEFLVLLPVVVVGDDLMVAELLVVLHDHRLHCFKIL